MSGKYALIIGNSEYQHPKYSPLACPCEDVEAVAELLRKPDIADFSVETLINQPVSKIKKCIETLFTKKLPDDTLLLYLVGHGVLDPNGRLYFVVTDTDPDYLLSTAIQASFIKDLMDNISRSRRQIIILDCCYAGAFAHGTMGSKNSIGTSVGIEAAFNGYGRVVLAATEATQYAWEGDKVLGETTKHSLFTHYLVEGLKTGLADTDRDGRITVDNLFEYIYQHVVQATNLQRPAKWYYKQQGNLVLAKSIKYQRINILYAQAKSAQIARDWERARNLFLKITEEDSDFQDVTVRLHEVEEQIEIQKRSVVEQQGISDLDIRIEDLKRAAESKFSSVRSSIIPDLTNLIHDPQLSTLSVKLLEKLSNDADSRVSEQAKNAIMIVKNKNDGDTGNITVTKDEVGENGETQSTKQDRNSTYLGRTFVSIKSSLNKVKTDFITGIARIFPTLQKRYILSAILLILMVAAVVLYSNKGFDKIIEYIKRVPPQFPSVTVTSLPISKPPELPVAKANTTTPTLQKNIIVTKGATPTAPSPSTLTATPTGFITPTSTALAIPTASRTPTKIIHASPTTSTSKISTNTPEPSAKINRISPGNFNQIKSISTWDGSHVQFSYDSIAKGTVDGKYILTYSSNQGLTLRNANTGSILHTFDTDYPKEFSPDGRYYLIFSEKDKSVQLWNISDFKLIRSFQGPTKYPKQYIFSPDSQLLAVYTEDGKIQVWNISDGEKRNEHTVYKADFAKLHFSPDGHYLIFASGAGTISIWDAETGILTNTIKIQSSLEDTAIPPDEAFVAVALGNGTIQIWDIETGSLIKTFPKHYVPFRHLYFSPNGSTLVSLSGGGDIFFWDVHNGMEKHSYDVGEYSNTVVSPDHSFVVSGIHFPKESVRLWSVETGIEIPTIGEPKYLFWANFGFTNDCAKMILQYDENLGTGPTRMELWSVTP